ncbi:MAG TPA: CHASE2 domain-containing protein [Methylotenera sp.]|nr:CHASE2 domain-containing protein [Methylotenera sp.]HPN01869.1 CHASE2 domain-containing protein [Methylotenera sp.]
MFTKLKLLLGQTLTKLTRKLKNNFYIYLATLFSLLVLVDANVFHVGLNMRDSAFDFMVKHRILQPKPDSNIVIVDINEASLQAFAKEFGSWPWSRQVMGELVENIQAQKPKAIVFDVLFSDADIFRPEGDEYFNEIIAGADNVFFPILRLDPSQDSKSALKFTQIPGLKATQNADKNATLAAILPHFEAALKVNRLGTHNVYPNNDGIVREYRMMHDDYGWQLPSLPLIVGEYNEMNSYPYAPIPKDMLINWRGKPFSYTYVSFSDVFTDLSSKIKKRSQDEFTDKIVIIGSTAPGLFDIKATAMDKQFPGVEILATAIDNVKHHDYLKVWRGKTPYILLSLLLIWLTTLAFYKNVDRDRFNRLFTSGQIGLLVLSYFAINLTNTYLDLTAPILWAVAFFGIAKVYALANDRALQRWLVFGAKSSDAETQIIVMPIAIESLDPENDDVLDDTLIKKLKRNIELISKTPCNIEVINGTQGGIWGLFGDMVAISWQFSENKPEYIAAAKQDAQHIAEQLPTLIEDLGLSEKLVVRYAVHEGKISHASALSLASQWRTLFAQSIIKLEHEQSTATKELA